MTGVFILHDSCTAKADDESDASLDEMILGRCLSGISGAQNPDKYQQTHKHSLIMSPEGKYH